MSNINSKIILSKNIKLDKRYKQVLSFTETQMYNLLTNNSNIVYTSSTYSFIRDKGTIKVNAPFGICIQANYMAFQNPDFSNKWFFAFIDKINYVGDNATEIYYTIDEWSTWFDYWDPKQCFIIRQHAVTDNVGSNTIPERIETGPYVTNGNVTGDSRFSNYAYLVVTSAPIEAITPEQYYVNMGGTTMNGFVYYCDDMSDVDYIVRTANAMTTPQNDVLFVYMIPSVLVPANAKQGDNNLLLSWNDPYFATYNPMQGAPTTIGGYTPINRKLRTYPYQYLLVENVSGQTNILRYEFFANNTITFYYYGVPSIGCSIICIPYNYNGEVLAIDEAIVGSKYPVLGWSEDAYINWLSENSVNLKQSWIATGLSIAGGVALTAGGIALTATGAGAGLGVGMISSGIGAIGTGGVSAFNGALEYYKHKQEPDAFKGNLNAGDVLTSIGAMGFNYRPMSIKQEYAIAIDRYFTRYGYAYNQVAYPNFLHRENYNYIQIASEDNIGYVNNHNNISVPASSMEIINNICRNGVTVWNNHTNFGDYSVTNGITS